MRLSKSKLIRLLQFFLPLFIIFCCSFTEETESASTGSNCGDLCVVKVQKLLLSKTIYACKAAANKSCSDYVQYKDDYGQMRYYSVSCNNAVVCYTNTWGY